MRASDFQEGVPSKIRPLDSQKKMGPEHLPYRTHLLGGAKGLNVCVVHQNFPARAPQSFRDIRLFVFGQECLGSGTHFSGR